MVGIGWAGLCLAAAYLGRRHLEALVVAIAVVWAAWPGVARTPFAIGPLDLHPAAVLLGCVIVVQAMWHPTRLFAPVRRAPSLIGTFAVVAVLVTLQTMILARGPEGVMFAVEQVVGSLGILLLVGAAIIERAHFADRLVGWLVGVVAVESIFALVQAELGKAVLFESAYQTQYWFNENFVRWMGTTDHPLVLSLMIVMVAPLLARPMPMGWRLAALVAMVGGMLVTQSRTGAAVLALELVYLLARARMGQASRVVTVVLLGVAGFVAAAIGSFAPLIERLTTDDGGSAAARSRSIEFITEHFEDFAWLGLGMNQSLGLAGQYGFGTSFENSFIMHLIDMGAPLAITYYGLMVACVLLGLLNRATPGAVVAAAAGILVVNTFSALGDRTASAAWLWIVLALAAYTSQAAEEWE